MDPLEIITTALTVFDWAIARANAAGETIPQAYLDQRTAFRREAVRLAGLEATNPDE